MPTPSNDQLKAGQIAAQVLSYAKTLVKPGASLLEITENIEKKILELGGSPAFPPQLSLNHIAAHNCPDSGDTVILSDQLVKIDIGVHVNGHIGDTACTIDLSGRHKRIVEAAENALNAALAIVRPGVELRKIGAAIQAEISKQGFAPVRNLSGHGLAEYEVHAPPSIPNYDNGDRSKLMEGQIIAIEPFATSGTGLVQEGTHSTLFSLERQVPLRMPSARAIQAHIAKNYGSLVFCKRWLRQYFKPYEIDFALKQMLELGGLKSYPPLGEQGRGLVSQAEHTLFVSNPPVILTKI